MSSSTLIFDGQTCTDLVRRVVEEQDRLSPEETEGLFEFYLQHPGAGYQLSALLAVMRHRGESAEEIMGLYRVIRRRMRRIQLDVRGAVDIGGTGGGRPTLNISTTAALIVAAAGVRVCKHGNYRVTSASGSFDLLACLGLNAGLCSSPGFAKELCERHGITFLSTRSYHDHPPALIHMRKRLGFGTAFNTIGPLLNPAGVPYQVVGVANPAVMHAAAKVLQAEGRSGFVLVHGREGIDEVSPCGPTDVLEFRDRDLRFHTLTPRNFGLEPIDPALMAGGSSEQNARAAAEILRGASPERLPVVLPTAALALYTCKAAESLAEGTALAREAVLSGRAAELLTDLQEALSCEQELSSAALHQ